MNTTFLFSAARAGRLFMTGVALLALAACHHGRSYWKEADQSEPQHIDIVRFDNDLLNVEQSTIDQDVRVLYDKYPAFMPLFVEDILGIPAEDTAYLAQALPQFLNDTLYGFRQTNSREQELFADVTSLEKSLSRAFTRILWLFPDLEVPTIYMFVSGFQTPVYFNDEIAAIGADMYLGSDYEYYNCVVYEYQKQTMRPECIPVDMISAYLFRMLPYTSTKSRLLDQMLYRGKIMYLTAQIFDDIPPYEVMGYTKEQWKWCERYERAIWHLVMDKRDLFKTESLVLTSYLNDGPFTSEVSQDAPGRLGIWLGWRIAESYMEHNPDVTLQSLIAEPDAQKILEESFYKP
ncbi:MAG: hypothetical protein K6A36_04570 [Paludibacteraceae bacterium]|nr:hypothetical protein [Paludibacteraceae bacterium]